MQAKKTFTLNLLAASLLCSQGILADTSLTFTDTNPAGESRSSTIQIHGNTVRTEEANNPVYTLYNSKKKTMYTINPEVKQYMAANIAIIKKNMTSAIEAQEKMKAQMKEQASKLPDEERNNIEKKMAEIEQLSKKSLPKMTIEASGKNDNILGLNCKTSTVSAEGKAIKEICIAKEGIDKEDMIQLKSMFSFMEEIAIETAKIRGIATPDTSVMPSQQKGLAVRTQALPTGVKSELSKLSKDNLDETSFTIPEGYTLFDPQASNQKQEPKP